MMRNNATTRFGNIWGPAILAAICSWYIAFLALGDAPPYLGYVNAFGFWLAALALLTGIALAIVRARAAAAFAALLTAVIVCHNVAAFTGNSPDSPPRDAKRLRLITASLRSLNHDMDAAAAALLYHQPDIIAVQEADTDALLAALDRHSGAPWRMATLRNEAVACRCAIEKMPGNDFLRARLRLASGPLTVWSIHAPKNYGRPAELRQFFAALRADMLAHQPGIVAGDLNATPWNDGYRIVAQTFPDTWLKAGSGPGFTFPTRARRAGWLFPYLRIDHVFASPPLEPLRAWNGAASHGADHLPVVVEFAVRRHAAAPAAMPSR